MPDDDQSPNVDPRHLAPDQGGRISALESEVAELRAQIKASRDGRGASPGTPPGDKDLATRITAVEQFISNLQGQNGITVTGGIISLDPIKATWKITCNADGTMDGTLIIP